MDVRRSRRLHHSFCRNEKMELKQAFGKAMRQLRNPATSTKKISVATAAKPTSVNWKPEEKALPSKWCMGSPLS